MIKACCTMDSDSDDSIVERLKPSICTKERVAQLQKAKQTIEGGSPTPRTKIQKVPHYLRENQEFNKYYSPKLISVGPIHHGDKNLRIGEEYKLLWTAMYLKENKEDHEGLCQTIHDHIEELKELYTEEAIAEYNDNDLVWMLFVDGCSVLQFMEKLDVLHPEELRIKRDQQEHVVRDLHLLENQVPYRALQLLRKDENKLLNSMFNFVSGGLFKFKDNSSFQEPGVQRLKTGVRDSLAKILGSPHKTLLTFGHTIYQVVKKFGDQLRHSDPEDSADTPRVQLKHTPIHLLDFVRLMLLTVDHEDPENDQKKHEVQIQCPGDINEGKQKRRVVWPRYKNIRELKAAGVRVKREETLRWSKISFTSMWFSGVLKLPWFYVDDSTPYIYLNMIAYEKCPDFPNNYEISSYLAFLDSLIDDVNDVKELRSAGVIQNLLGSDEEVVKLFNDIGTELATKGYYVLSVGTMAYNEKCIKVKYEMETHCRSNCKTWMAQAYNTHFSNPWSFVAFGAAVLALGLTFIQAWFAIHPKN